MIWCPICQEEIRPSDGYRVEYCLLGEPTVFFPGAVCHPCAKLFDETYFAGQEGDINGAEPQTETTQDR